MTDRFTPHGWWLPVVTAVMGLLLGGLLMAGLMHTPGCSTALDLGEQRLGLTESNTALVYDAWAADVHDDTHLMEYSTAGLSANHDELADIESEYQEASNQCLNK